jgi:hypothetical protein
MALLTIVIAIVVPFDHARAKGFYAIAFKSEKERYKKGSKEGKSDNICYREFGRAITL